ncbi:MAG: hypothetical protein FJ144_11565 [Deltaproteobacteria bacterium]|nr:hypothetical protein [Deltaproteobacteria bacterium]
MMADPAYQAIEPYKLMAMQLLLTPLAGEIALPPLTWLVGMALLTLYLTVGWWRAARALRALGPRAAQ